MIHPVLLLFPLIALSCARESAMDGSTDGTEADAGDPGDADRDDDEGGDPVPDGACEDGTVPCPSGCVDLETSHDNCGACGRACEAVEVCSGGECLLECPSGEVDCLGSCLAGTDHRGDDLVVSADGSLSGLHGNIGLFHVMPGTTLRVETYSVSAPETSGWLKICADEIIVEGTLDASGAGYGGGAAGGAGGGIFGGGAGSGGDGRGDGCEIWNESPLQAGGDGGAGVHGGYASAGVNGDVSTDAAVLLGSGGGGGGSGGSGTTATCCGVSASGGSGGRGGEGGRGGGAVMLMAEISITVHGGILTSGIAGAAGEGGGDGESESSLQPGLGCDACNSCGDHRYAWCPGQGPCGSAANDCCQQECCFYYTGGKGGTGGAGGGGSGGGILLVSPQILTGAGCSADALGGGGRTENGGTLKVFVDDPPDITCLSSLFVGRICVGQPMDALCADLP
jgi:hypothetical protein